MGKITNWTKVEDKKNRMKWVHDNSTGEKGTIRVYRQPEGRIAAGSWITEWNDLGGQTMKHIAKTKEEARKEAVEYMRHSNEFWKTPV